MVDCIQCKHWITNNNAYYECELGALKPTDSFPKLDCENYEKEIEGKKYDTGKNRMGLVLKGFAKALWEVGKVGTFGATKYGDENWMYLDNAKSRYLDALCRHLFQYMEGYYYDAESKLPHLSHMCWNALALLKFESELVHEPPIEMENDNAK